MVFVCSWRVTVNTHSVRFLSGTLCLKARWRGDRKSTLTHRVAAFTRSSDPAPPAAPPTSCACENSSRGCPFSVWPVGHEAEVCTDCMTTGAVLPGRFNNAHLYCCYNKREEQQKEEKGKEESCVLPHKELRIPVMSCAQQDGQQEGPQWPFTVQTRSKLHHTTYCNNAVWIAQSI